MGLSVHGKGRRGLQWREQQICRQTKWLSEQVSSDGALNGCDREKAVRGSGSEGGSDPETVCVSAARRAL